MSLGKPKYSLMQWCIDNNRQDIIDRWDYEKNNFGPEDIGYASEKKVWFKCLKGIHESELYSIANNKTLKCKACNSFAQYVIDNDGEEYLNIIWAEDNQFSPWDIMYSSHKKIKLLIDGNIKETSPEKYTRPTKRISPNDETVTKEKSLASLYPITLDLWSDKNEKSPYEYYSGSNAEVWWKCENNMHEDFLRRISSSKANDFRCPTCGRLGAGLIDLTGNVYGELTVLGFDKSIDGIPYWKCHCSCNRDVSIRGVTLRTGNACTCGASYHYLGENNPNWKGGEKTLNQKLRSSKPYKHWRDAIIDKYGCIDVITGEECKNPELHHVYPMSTFPQYMSEEWNTVILENYHHSMFSENGFHKMFGSKNNTPEQFEEYVNIMRKQYGINEPFNINEYIEKRKEQAMVNPIEKPDFSYYLKEE